MLLRAKHLQAATWEHCWLHVGKSSSQDKCLCWELQPKRVVLTTKGSANPWCNKYAATLIKYTGQTASLSFCAEQTLSWQQSRDLFDVMWHYFFSCSSCCYLSSACSFSQSVSRGNFWCAEKELTQQRLPPSASSGAGPIFLHCQQRWWVVAWRGPGWAAPEFGSTACPVCGGKSSASISLPSEAQDHSLQEQKRMRRSIPHWFAQCISQWLCRQAFRQVAGYHKNNIPRCHLFLGEGH